MFPIAAAAALLALPAGAGVPSATPPASKIVFPWSPNGRLVAVSTFSRAGALVVPASGGHQGS